MHSLFFVIVSASIAVAQNPFRDSAEATDNPGPGVETFNLGNNDPNPTFSLDALNLLGDNSEAPKVLIPETDNDRIYNAYLPNLLVYKPEILYDFSDTPVAPESDENGRLPISDALNSGIPEASRLWSPT